MQNKSSYFAKCKIRAIVTEKLSFVLGLTAETGKKGVVLHMTSVVQTGMDSQGGRDP